MDYGVYSINEITDEKISNIIEQRQSFVLSDIPRTNMGEAVKAVEKLIEEKGLKCRIYTKARVATMVGLASTNPFTALAGLTSAVGIGIHNAVTWNPDYEIAKNFVMGTLTITHKK